MKLTLNILHYPVQPRVQTTRLPEPVSESAGDPQQRVAPAPPPSAPAPMTSVDLNYRDRQFSQQSLAGERIPMRGQQAVQAYSSITEIDQRNRMSELLGLDEYA